MITSPESMIVYKNYTQEELDLQYNNRFHVPDFENYLHRWEALSRNAVKELVIASDIAYGDKPRECLDIFPSPSSGSKTLIFIHGGYWHLSDKSVHHFVAASFAAYGITTVIINYPLAHADAIGPIVQSCGKAIDWVIKNIGRFGGEPGQLFLAGHSAGAHLATMAAIAADALTKNCIKGVCGISGLYNLLPIQLCNINDVLQMDKETAVSNSPVLKGVQPSCSLLIAVGGDETNEFLDQSREFFVVMENDAGTSELMIVPGRNHFSILDSFCDLSSPLHKSMCRMMKLDV